MSVAVSTRGLHERAIEVLRRAGNPFRNYFARNPDDEVCAAFTSPSCSPREREQLLGVVDLYRYDADHALRGRAGAGQQGRRQDAPAALDQARRRAVAWQLLVTPGTLPEGHRFLEYLLFQVIDTLLGGGKQKGARPAGVRRRGADAADCSSMPGWKR